jgi:hypothetical protein
MQASSRQAEGGGERDEIGIPLHGLLLATAEFEGQSFEKSARKP